MTGLLVSVRDAAEAQAALRGGASLIDVKEPRNGSLGAATPEVWREIREVAGANCPVSAALGELLDLSPKNTAAWREPLAGYQFAKIGLAGCGGIADWQSRWRAALAQLPAGAAPVGVIYADWESAAAPPPGEVFQAAQACRCAAILVDTYRKTNGRITDFISREDLATLLSSARAAQLTTVLAGSLTLSLARELLPLSPDFLAVRGAVCRGGRVGSVDEGLVAEFAKTLLSSRDQAKHFSSPAGAIFAA